MSVPRKKLDLRVTGRTSAKYKPVEKAYLNTKKLSLGEERFVWATLWIPKANPQYKKPRLVLKIALGDDSVSLMGESYYELESVVAALFRAVTEARDKVLPALAKEQDAHARILALLQELEEAHPPP